MNSNNFLALFFAVGFLSLNFAQADCGKPLPRVNCDRAGPQQICVSQVVFDPETNCRQVVTAIDQKRATSDEPESFQYYLSPAVGERCAETGKRVVSREAFRKPADRCVNVNQKEIRKNVEILYYSINTSSPCRAIVKALYEGCYALVSYRRVSGDDSSCSDSDAAPELYSDLSPYSLFPKK